MLPRITSLLSSPERNPPRQADMMDMDQTPDGNNTDADDAMRMPGDLNAHEPTERTTRLMPFRRYAKQIASQRTQQIPNMQTQTPIDLPQLRTLGEMTRLAQGADPSTSAITDVRLICTFIPILFTEILFLTVRT